MNDRIFYRRNLPHLQPAGGTFFVTFRLHGSLPQSVIQTLITERERIEMRLQTMIDSKERETLAEVEDKRMFGKWDHALDVESLSPRWLADPQIAKCVADSLHFYDDKAYILGAYCIMPNHVHLVCTTIEQSDGTFRSLTSVLQSIKSYTAHRANKLLGRSGAFWQAESYDHLVRDHQEYNRIVAYVLNNPYKAGLVIAPEVWLWNYVRE